MVDEQLLKEAIKWCKDNGYENLLENEDLVIALYKKRVLGESVRRRRNLARFKKLDSIEMDEVARAGIVVVELVKERMTKSGKWQIWFIGGDDTKMMEFISYPFGEKPDIEEGEFYIVSGKVKEDMYLKKKVFSFWAIEPVEKEIIDKMSIVMDFIESFGNGKSIRKDKFDKIFSGEDKVKEKVKQLLNLVDKGDVYELE